MRLVAFVALLATIVATADAASYNESYWTMACVPQEKGTCVYYVTKITEDGTASAADTFPHISHQNMADSSAFYKKRGLLLTSAFIDSVMFISDVRTRQQYEVRGFDGSSDNCEVAGLTIDQSTGMVYFLVMVYSNGKYEVWSINLEKDPSTNWDLTKHSNLTTPSSTFFCHSLVLGKPGYLYAMECVQLTRPFYAIEINIATGEWRNAPLACEWYLDNAECVDNFAVERFDANTATFLLYAVSSDPAVLVRTKIDFAQGTGDCSVIYTFNQTDYFSGRGAALIPSATESGYLYALLAQTSADEEPVKPTISMSALAPGAPNRLAAHTARQQQRLARSAVRGITGYRVDLTTGGLNATYKFDTSKPPVSALVGIEMQRQR